MPRISIACILVAASLLSAHPLDAVAKSAVSEISLHRQGSQSLRALFDAELAAAKKNGKSVVVVFTADWCTPCRALKELMNESPVVADGAKRGHFVYIDVDEWRGPAQELIPGADAQQLPMLARVDNTGMLVQKAMGTELGLLSEAATASNLALLISGKAPEAPAYLANSTEQQSLVRKSAEKQSLKNKGVSKLDIAIKGRPGAHSPYYVLDVTFRNPDARRKWFALCGYAGGPMAERPVVQSWDEVKFDQHVRATYFRLHGDTEMILIPVGGDGSVTLKGWIAPPATGATVFEAWELDRLTWNGQQMEFDKKLPYALVLQDASKGSIVRGAQEAPAIEMAVSDRLSRPLSK